MLGVPGSVEVMHHPQQVPMLADLHYPCEQTGLDIPKLSQASFCPTGWCYLDMPIKLSITR